MKEHCCNEMNSACNFVCDIHSNEFECPDVLIRYLPRFDEYGIVIHDGGSAVSRINYCPYCGSKLPESKRELWFDTLEAIGFSEPFEQDIPKEFLSDEWFLTRSL